VFDYEGNEEVLEKRNKLRRDIKNHQYCRWKEYSCQYGGKDEEGKLTTTHLQEFEATVMEDLWRAICFEFPEREPSRSSLARETGFHTQ